MKVLLENNLKLLFSRLYYSFFFFNVQGLNQVFFSFAKWLHPSFLIISLITKWRIVITTFFFSKLSLLITLN